MSFIPTTSVRWRLTLTYAVLFVFAGAATLGVSYFLVYNRQHRKSTEVAVLCSGSSSGSSGGQSESVQEHFSSGSESLSGPIVVAGNCAEAVQTNGAFGLGTVPPSGLPVSASGGGAIGPTPQLIQQLERAVDGTETSTLNALLVGSTIALGLMSVVSLGLGWIVAGRVLRPVHRITATARRLSEQTLDDRINLTGPDDEIKELADTFDAMIGRLDQAFISQRRFVANASHELRTPLATQGVLIDEALANRDASAAELRAILEKLRINSHESERLLESLLILARSQRGVERWERVDLAGLAEAAVERAGPGAAAAGVELRRAIQPVSATGDHGLLERLTTNLVDNGVRHNQPAGGWIMVTTRPHGEFTILEVENTGPVIDAETVPTLLEPFRRGGPDRSSTGPGLGLGLSIVDAVVTAHRGELTLTARPDGGLLVRVRVRARPRSEPPALAGAVSVPNPPT